MKNIHSWNIFLLLRHRLQTSTFMNTASNCNTIKYLHEWNLNWVGSNIVTAAASVLTGLPHFDSPLPRLSLTTYISNTVAQTVLLPPAPCQPPLESCHLTHFTFIASPFEHCHMACIVFINSSHRSQEPFIPTLSIWYAGKFSKIHLNKNSRK